MVLANVVFFAYLGHRCRPKFVGYESHTLEGAEDGEATAPCPPATGATEDREPWASRRQWARQQFSLISESISQKAVLLRQKAVLLRDKAALANQTAAAWVKQQLRTASSGSSTETRVVVPPNKHARLATNDISLD